MSNEEKTSYIIMEWLQIKKLSIKYSSYCKYQSIIENYIEPFFKEKNINFMNEMTIASFMDDLLNNKKLSTTFIQTIKYVLQSIYQYGEQKYHLDHIDFNCVKIIKRYNQKGTINKNEETYLYQYCVNHKDKISVAICLGLYSGLRLGEICALKWEDIDFANGIIHVNKTAQRIKNNNNNSSKTMLLVSDPKTNSSNRNVIMPHFLADYLKEYFIYSNINEKNLNYFVLSNCTLAQEPRTIQRQFEKVCQKYGFKYNFHTLRHTFATNCINIGIDIKTVSEMLGHSSVNITLNRYVHPSLDYKKEQMNKIQIPKMS